MKHKLCPDNKACPWQCAGKKCKREIFSVPAPTADAGGVNAAGSWSSGKISSTADGGELVEKAPKDNKLVREIRTYLKAAPNKTPRGNSLLERSMHRLIELQTLSPPPVDAGLVEDIETLKTVANAMFDQAREECGKICGDQCCQEIAGGIALLDIADSLSALTAQPASQRSDVVTEIPTCNWSWMADGFIKTGCGEELYIEHGTDYMPNYCQCCGKQALQGSEGEG